MSYRAKIALCFMVFSLTSCSKETFDDHLYYKSGVMLSDEQLSRFAVGDEMNTVVNALGQPQKTSKIAGSTLIIYTYQQHSRLPFSTTPTIYRAVVFKFDSNSKLEGYWKRSSGL